MPISRRAVLRDTALAAVAGAAGYSLSTLKGCNSSSFQPGVRIFFEGSWLFCADPKADPNAPATSICAVSMQMKKPEHLFSYGRWIPGLNWNDAERPQLPCYDSTKSDSMPTVTIGKNPPPAGALSDLFAKAQTDGPFIYLPNVKTGTPYAVDFGQPNIVVVKVPIPTQIIPAAFRPNTEIKDGGHMNKPPSTCDQSLGIATSHIFDYQGSDALQFSLDPATTVDQSTGPLGHYHFHTAPKTDDDHNMLGCLLGLIAGFPVGDVSIVLKDPSFKIRVGPKVPDCVKPEEFELTGDKGWTRSWSGDYSHPAPTPPSGSKRPEGPYIAKDGDCPVQAMLAGQPTCGNGSAALGRFQNG